MKWFIACIIFLLSNLAFSTELWIKLEDPSDSCPVFINGGFYKVITKDTIKLKNLASGTYTVSMFSDFETENTSKNQDYANLYFAFDPNFANLFGLADASVQQKIYQVGTVKVFLDEKNSKIVTLMNKSIKSMLKEKEEKFNCIIASSLILLFACIMYLINA